MKKTLTLLLLLCICGCQATNPKQELYTAQNAFLRVVNSLTILREAGKFDSEEIEDIEEIIKVADRLLDRWTIAVLSDKPMPNAMGTFEIILGDLIEYKLKGESDE